jgi:4'-phosphopantetheinyl transferase
LDRVLVQEERERAERYHFERDRVRFIAGRALLRHILGGYLEIHPAELAFSYGEKGKPYVSQPGVHAALMFNLAHSEDLALLAVTRAGPVGVDVERIRPVPEVHQLVARFFSPRETAAFGTLPESQQPEAFFNLWTRKEAWLKATGAGIGGGLDQIEVSFLPGEPARVLSLGRIGDMAGQWCLRELQPAPGFTGAIAIAVPQAKIQCWQWPLPTELRAVTEAAL